MKKTLHILLLSVCLLLLVSCSLFGGGDDPEETTAPPVTTTAPSAAEDPATLFAAIEAAVPTRAEVEVSSRYSSPSVTLTAELLFLHTDLLDYYSYRIERLLPLEEALQTGEVKTAEEGYLTVGLGGTVTSASDEITSELLSELSSLSVRLPALEAAVFSELSIEREGDTVTLGGRVKDAYIPLLLSPYGDEATALSITVTLCGEALLPSTLTMCYTSADGAAVTVEASYSYGDVSIPE